MALICESCLPTVVMNLVRHAGHGDVFHAAQRQIEDDRGVLVQRLLPEGVHRQVAHDDVHETAGRIGLKLLDVLANRVGQQAVG